MNIQIRNNILYILQHERSYSVGYTYTKFIQLSLGCFQA